MVVHLEEDFVEKTGINFPLKNNLSTSYTPKTILIYSKGYFGKANINLGHNETNRLFQNSATLIIKRLCQQCEASHREIYYRYFGDPKSIDIYQELHHKWMGKSGNKIYSSHEQRRLLSFNLYSSYTEAILDTNPWSICSGGQFYIGFPGFCGKVDLATAQWTETSVSRGGVSFFIYDSSERDFLPSNEIFPQIDFQLFEDRRSSLVEMTKNGAKALQIICNNASTYPTDMKNVIFIDSDTDFPRPVSAELNLSDGKIFLRYNEKLDCQSISSNISSGELVIHDSIFALNSTHYADQIGCEHRIIIFKLSDAGRQTAVAANFINTSQSLLFFVDRSLAIDVALNRHVDRCVHNNKTCMKKIILVTE